jgi:hypothetical protein
VPYIATPDIQPWQEGSEDGGGGKLLILTLRDLLEPTLMVGLNGGNDVRPKPQEKSDHPIVAWKPGNADGAKGVMG